MQVLQGIQDHTYRMGIQKDNAIRQELRLFFGNNSRYYRYFNGKRRLTEKQKVWIEKLFESYGYADIQFDRNLEEVDI